VRKDWPVNRNEDVIAWSSFRGKLGSQAREGFMSQVSPDGRYVMTTVKPPGTENQDLYYVANFTDYRFLQVFYPTRGILVWYDRETREVHPLPGADDPRYAHANAVWSPDGKFLVFARAAAKEAYPAGVPLGEIRQRSQRDSDPVRSLPDSLQRRPRRPA